MAAAQLQFFDCGTGAAHRRIAYLQDSVGQGGAPSGRPGLIWLCGFKSEMTSTKASALAEFARARGYGCLRFDYSGHGQSGGRFEDGTLSRWLEEARAAFARTQGPQILVGSSMGGYLALLLLRALLTDTPAEAQRILGLALIAPAWDMTQTLMWERFPQSVRDEIARTGVYLRPSHYGDGPYAITRALIEDGRRHLIGTSAFDPGRPVHVLHGLLDPDVPWEHTLDLAAHLGGDWVRVTAVPDGEHRLSRPEDLQLLFGMIDTIAGGAA